MTRALFAAVYADPRADARRAVLADHLLELGDPRGEFIVRQLAGGEHMTKEETALRRRHRDGWLGALHRVVDARAKFRRGFVVRCRTVQYERDAVRALIGDASRGTIEHLDTDVAEFVSHPCMRALSSIGVSFATLRELCLRGQPLAHIEAITLRLTGCPPRSPADVVASKALPSLRELTVVHKRATERQRCDWLASSTLVRQLHPAFHREPHPPLRARGARAVDRSPR